MAKRMQYSVVGLPHYTIWHLYEPSADDLRHMEEMEAERVQRETEEKEREERERKISADFDTGMKDEWEADKQAVEASLKGKENERQGGEGGSQAMGVDAMKAKHANARVPGDDPNVVLHIE